MTLPAPPRLFLFDFDGVIVESTALKLRGFTTVYAAEDPAKVEQVAAYAELHGGVTRRVKFAHFERNLFGRSGDDASVDALCARYQELVYQSVLDCPFVPGALGLLKRLQGRIPAHLISGTPEAELRQIVTARGLDPYFRSVRGAPATKPDLFAHILKAEGCAAADALAVGDSLTECIAAADLGIPFLGVVPAGEGNPFPARVPVLPSLEGAAALLRLA